MIKRLDKPKKFKKCKQIKKFCEELTGRAVKVKFSKKMGGKDIKDKMVVDPDMIIKEKYRTVLLTAAQIRCTSPALLELNAFMWPLMPAERQIATIMHELGHLCGQRTKTEWNEEQGKWLPIRNWETRELNAYVWGIKTARAYGADWLVKAIYKAIHESKEVKENMPVYLLAKKRKVI